MDPLTIAYMALQVADKALTLRIMYLEALTTEQRAGVMQREYERLERFEKTLDALIDAAKNGFKDWTLPTGDKE